MKELKKCLLAAVLFSFWGFVIASGTILLTSPVRADDNKNICGTDAVLDAIEQNVSQVYNGSGYGYPKLLSVEQGWTVSEEPFVCKVKLIFNESDANGIYKYSESTSRKGDVYFEIEPIETRYDQQLDQALKEYNDGVDKLMEDTERGLKRIAVEEMISTY